MTPVAVFNRQWKRFLFSSRNLALLDGYGWNDGGCWTLAEAIKIWANNERIVRLDAVWSAAIKRSDRDILNHVVVQLIPHGIYLDGDGILTFRQLVDEKMPDELVNGHCYIRPLLDMFEYSKVCESFGIEFNEKAASILAERLEKRFGSFHQAINSIGFPLA
ncbi:MAG: hypothetical protein IM631_12310 [Cytophagales bacterium]|jgi:hypothetical protein|nr:hypothetical protein [Cytophagales bacterium]MCA6382298.1 hypothetical protein [Cytophagales bacterium]